MRMIASLALLGLIAIAQQGSAKAPVENVSPLTLTPCEIRGVQGKARCGDYEVFENRATKKGRKIRLKIVVLSATGAKRTPANGQESASAAEVDRAADPFVYISGGPGSSAIEDAPGIAQAFKKIRERRDLVFVDQRGTGGSNPLDCEFFNPADAQSYLGSFFPLEDVKKCRERLEGKAQRGKGNEEKGKGGKGKGERGREEGGKGEQGKRGKGKGERAKLSLAVKLI